MSEASLNAQLDKLETNIDDLNDIILELVKKEEPYKFKIKWLTKRQFAKKMLLASSSTPDDEETKKSIHMLVYGKYLVENGKLIDNEDERPDCVETRKGKEFKKPMSEKHPMLRDTYKKMKKELNKSIKMLSVKTGEIKLAVKQTNIQIATATAAIASSATIQPSGSGVPVAIAGAQSIVTSIYALIAKVSEIMPFLEPLLNVALLIASDVVEAVIAGINIILVLINTVLVGVTLLKKAVEPLATTLKMG